MDVRHAAVDASCGSNELFFGTPQGDAKCFQKFYKQVGSRSGNLFWACFPLDNNTSNQNQTGSLHIFP